MLRAVLASVSTYSPVVNAVPGDSADEGDPLGPALLPVLMHSLGGATQMLSSLNAVLALPDGRRWLDAKASDLGAVSREIEDLGWLLAVLASAAGADLLQARREERGLEIIVRAVRDALRRSGRDLAGAERSLPRLAPNVADGWQLPWSVGALLLASGSALGSESGALEWGLEREPRAANVRLWAHCEPETSQLACVVTRVRERLAAARFDRAERGWQLEFPATWLLPPREEVAP